MVEIEQVKAEEAVEEEETPGREKVKIGEWTELMGEQLVMKVSQEFRVKNPSAEKVSQCFYE
jgi:hypothetical protein